MNINVFGSASKYKTILLEIDSPAIANLEVLHPEKLLGRIVYVNYPQTHEARVVAISRYFLTKCLPENIFISQK